MRAFRLFITTLALAVATVSARAETLVFAAASLTDALSDVGAAYEKTGKPKPVFSFAASSALARQIESGAPAAIFISADEQWMDYVAERKLIEPSSRLQLLGNSVVLISPATDPLNVKIGPNFPLAKALGTGKLAMGDPDSVPVGKYGKAALENLGVWADVEKSVVRAENVRAALAFVERGEAKAGIVYATDAAVAKNVKVVDTFPAASHPAVTYPVALLGSAPSAEAKDFYAYLTGASAKDIYRRYGFTVK
ncbi:MAG: molybdate ABC transporter substrate-binding protein [Rhodospirillaceae bacterium]|nr:molybdate ABC transporter substrate-binding protein [Rhodospirillaceae bacterium]